MDEDEDIDYCKDCKFTKVSYTVLSGGQIMRERYCGLTKSDEYCHGANYEKDE